jgi:REP element-mobilizing transposase RayT
VTTQTYRRARHSVSLLHDHLVFVTKYRRAVFTDAMLTFCEQTMRAVCAELDVELVEFNGEADHTHLLVAYPPTLAICVLAHRLKGRTAYAVRIHGRLSPRPHAWPSLVAVLLRRLLRRRTPVHNQATHRRTSPTTLNAGLRPAIHGMG